MPMKLSRIFRRRRSDGQKRDNADKQKPSSNLLKRVGTHLTLNHSSFSDDIDNSDYYGMNSSIHTIQETSANTSHSQHHGGVYQVLELNNATSSFQEQFAAIQRQSRLRKRPRALVLLNFVETSTRHDVHALANLLDNEQYKWTKVQLVDAVSATESRRWRYKKDNICHHIKDICKARDIPLEFEGSMRLDLDELPTVEAAVGILKEMEKDWELTQLTLTGRLNDRQTTEVFQALVALLSRNDRTWSSVSIDIAFGGESPLDYQHWHQIMQQYRMLFVQMQMQYGIPIELGGDVWRRPYAQ